MQNEQVLISEKLSEFMLKTRTTVNTGFSFELSWFLNFQVNISLFSRLIFCTENKTINTFLHSDQDTYIF